MMYQRCTVYKLNQLKDEFGTPTWEEWEVFKVYKCRVGKIRNKATNNDETPRDTENISMMLYLPVQAQIKMGDLVEIDKVKYKTSSPYFLKSHIEVEITRFEEV